MPFVSWRPRHASAGKSPARSAVDAALEALAGTRASSQLAIDEPARRELRQRRHRVGELRREARPAAQSTFDADADDRRARRRSPMPAVSPSTPASLRTSPVARSITHEVVRPLEADRAVPQAAGDLARLGHRQRHDRARAATGGRARATSAGSRPSTAAPRPTAPSRSGRRGRDPPTARRRSRRTPRACRRAASRRRRRSSSRRRRTARSARASSPRSRSASRAGGGGSRRRVGHQPGPRQGGLGVDRVRPLELEGAVQRVERRREAAPPRSRT